jgi:hypothetical protein
MQWAALDSSLSAASFAPKEIRARISSCFWRKWAGETPASWSRRGFNPLRVVLGFKMLEPLSVREPPCDLRRDLSTTVRAEAHVFNLHFAHVDTIY